MAGKQQANGPHTDFIQEIVMGDVIVSVDEYVDKKGRDAFSMSASVSGVGVGGYIGMTRKPTDSVVAGFSAELNKQFEAK